MSISRGVVVDVISTGARPISVSSTIPIALVLTAVGVSVGVRYFDSIKAALSDVEIAGATGGNILKYLKFGEDKYGLIVPLIVSVAHVDADAAVEKSNVITAVNLLATAPSIFGIRPDIIGVGDYASDIDVQNALVATCDKLKARTFVDLDATDNAGAITSRAALGSRRVTPVFTNLMDWNTVLNATDEYSASVVLAYLRASIDGSKDIGYSYSISNRVIPVSGVKKVREFLAGFQDETDPLNEKQITSFINYTGIRTWNYQTCDVDPIWQDARRVRIFDLASFAVIDGIFWAVDRDLAALDAAQDSLRAFMGNLVGQDVMLGFNVYLNKALTTPTAITNGEFYFTIEAQETPSPSLIKVTFDRTDAYSSVVYERLA
ncbi:MAG TPA: phage tail protein [Sulfurimonas sp. UBA12504]|nr:MAG TPA: phage tail protein [Sulfurimonas sp. UBA12504]